MSATIDDFACGCLLTDVGKGPQIEEPADFVAEEPKCMVFEGVQESEAQTLLQALTAGQLMANVYFGEESSSSGGDRAPDKTRASCRRLPAAGLIQKAPTEHILWWHVRRMRQ